MQVQKIILDGVSKAIVYFNKEGKTINGVHVQFNKSNCKFQVKVGKIIDEFIKTVDK